MVFIIGFGAMVLVGPEAVAKAGGGGNMAAPLLALAVGGNAFFGFICAVAFATMLAVVAGLTLSGVATVCHDVWTNVVRNGTASEAEQLKVARVATVAISILAIILGIALEGQLPVAGAGDYLAPLHDTRRGREHPGGNAEFAGSDLFVADDPGRPPGQAAGRNRRRLVVRIAAQPRHHQHAVVVLCCDHPVAVDDGSQRLLDLRGEKNSMHQC